MSMTTLREQERSSGKLDPEPYRLPGPSKLPRWPSRKPRFNRPQQGTSRGGGIRAAYNNVKLAKDQVTESIAKRKASLATLDKAEGPASTRRGGAAPGKNLLAVQQWNPAGG